MKKIILTLVLMANTLCNYAQWYRENVEADELRGTPSKVITRYTDSNNFQFIYTNNNVFTIIAPDTFIFTTSESGVTHPIIGIYDENDKLISVYNQYKTIFMECERYYQGGNFNIASIDTNKWDYLKKTKKPWLDIKNHVENNKGYIKIILPIYGKNDYTMIIPCQNH